MKYPKDSEKKRPARLLTHDLFGLVIMFLRGRLVIRGTKNADPWLRRGWLLESVDTEYWSTSGGGFDSEFIYTLVPRSRVLRYVAKGVEKAILKASVLLNFTNRSRRNQNPSAL